MKTLVTLVGDSVDEPGNGGGDGPAEATFSRFMRCFISLDFAFSSRRHCTVQKIECKMQFKLIFLILCSCNRMYKIAARDTVVDFCCD